MASRSYQRPSSRPCSSSSLSSESTYTSSPCSTSSRRSSATPSLLNSPSPRYTSLAYSSTLDSPTHATCAHPSWPTGRSLSTSQGTTAPLSLSTSPTSIRSSSSSSSYKSSPSYQYTSSYRPGASAFISDDDLRDPSLDIVSTRRRDLDMDGDDCIAPGYHFVSGRPRPTGPRLGMMDRRPTIYVSNSSRSSKPGRKSKSAMKYSDGLG